MTSTSNLMNYEFKSSDSKNYDITQKTSSPESLPAIMEGGVLIQYESINFLSEIIEVAEESEGE